MTLTRTTIETAIAAIDVERADRRRALRSATSGAVEVAINVELDRLNTAHAELAAWLDLVDAEAALVEANAARKLAEAELLALADESFA